MHYDSYMYHKLFVFSSPNQDPLVEKIARFKVEEDVMVKGDKENLYHVQYVMSAAWGKEKLGKEERMYLLSLVHPTSGTLSDPTYIQPESNIRKFF